MFYTISWQSYWCALALLLVIYFIVIYLVYYRRDLKLPFIEKQFPPKKGNGFQLFDKESHSEFDSPPDGTEEHIVYACMDEMNAFFDEASKKRWHKNELLYSLQLILKKYPSLKTSQYRSSIFNVIASQSEHICNIHLNAEEANEVWLGS